MSPTGTLAAFYGALLISVVSTVLGNNGDMNLLLFFSFVILIGWLGCQVDSIWSIIGKSRFLGKHSVTSFDTQALCLLCSSLRGSLNE